jgi:hypothetical protein
MRCKILSDKSLKVLRCSNARSSAIHCNDTNLRLDPLGGEKEEPLQNTLNQNKMAKLETTGRIKERPMGACNPSDSVGRTFLLNKQDNTREQH